LKASSKIQIITETRFAITQFRKVVNLSFEI
jgi:hypothetical protein